MRQERDGGLSLRHGVRDNVDRGTGCVGRDTSSPRMSLHTTLLLAELLRLLRERRRVRQEEAPGEDGPAVLALVSWIVPLVLYLKGPLHAQGHLCFLLCYLLGVLQLAFYI